MVRKIRNSMEDQRSIHSVDSHRANPHCQIIRRTSKFRNVQYPTVGYRRMEVTPTHRGNSHFQRFSTKSDENSGFWHLDSMDAEGNTARKE